MGNDWRLDCIITGVSRQRMDEIFNILVESVGEVEDAVIVGDFQEEREYGEKDTN